MFFMFESFNLLNKNCFTSYFDKGVIFTIKKGAEIYKSFILK